VGTVPAGNVSAAETKNVGKSAAQRAPLPTEVRITSRLILGIARIVGEADADTMQESTVVRRG